MSANELKKWGEEAYALLKDIEGTHCIKKRATILALADAVYAGSSLNNVLKNNQTTGSKTAHYKWLDNDPGYAAAYAFLVGQLLGTDETKRGLAWTTREAELDDDRLIAVVKIEKARIKLDMLSLRAVDAYAEALDAEYVTFSEGGEAYHTADHRTRLIAANAITDRVPKLVKSSQVDLTSGGKEIKSGMTLDEWRNEQARRRLEAEADTANTLDIFEDE